MRFLVTGGAGYVGSTVSDELIKAGQEVTILDSLIKGHRAAVPREAAFVQGEVGDRDLLRSLFARGRFDGVLHFAALIEAGESMKQPGQFFRNNAATTLTLLETMLEFGVKRIVFSSTAALYGNPDKTPIEEDARLQPTNPYGESKLMVEQMLGWFHRIHGLRYASLRYFNAAGAAPDRGENHKPETHLIPRILQVPLGKADHVKIFGTDYDTPDGTCIRDYIHILDLASAHVLAAGALAERDAMIFNLGNGAGFSIREVIDAARKVTGHPIPAVEEERRAGDPAVLIASSAKIRKELGWAPEFTSLELIIRTAWDWHRAHPEGYV